MPTFVQFQNAQQSEIVSVFGCPQDAQSFPHQGAVEDDDERLVHFRQFLGAPEGFGPGVKTQAEIDAEAALEEQTASNLAAQADEVDPVPPAAG